MVIEKVCGLYERDIIRLRKDAENVPSSEWAKIFRDHYLNGKDTELLLNNSNRFQCAAKSSDALMQRTIACILNAVDTASGHPLVKGKKHKISGEAAVRISMLPMGLRQAVHLDTIPHQGWSLIVILILTDNYDLMVQPGSAYNHEQEADEWSTETALCLRMDAGNLLIMRSFLRHGGAHNTTDLRRGCLHLQLHVDGEEPKDLKNETVIAMVGRTDLTLRSSSKLCFMSAFECV